MLDEDVVAVPEDDSGEDDSGRTTRVLLYPSSRAGRRRRHQHGVDEVDRGVCGPDSPHHDGVIDSQVLAGAGDVERAALDGLVLSTTWSGRAARVPGGSSRPRSARWSCPATCRVSPDGGRPQASSSRANTVNWPLLRASTMLTSEFKLPERAFDSVVNCGLFESATAAGRWTCRPTNRVPPAP